MEKTVKLLVEVKFDDNIYDEKELCEHGSILFYERDMEGKVVKKME